jgi:hypothetical protein
MGFVDKDAIEALNTAVGDALRPLGVTVAMEPTISYDPSQNAVVMQIIAVVGDSAFEKLGQTDEQKKNREEMQKLAREQQESRVDGIIQDTKGELERLLKGEDIFDDPMDAPCPVTGEEHKLHPAEGFCMDCKAGLEE